MLTLRNSFFTLAIVYTVTLLFQNCSDVRLNRINPPAIVQASKGQLCLKTPTLPRFNKMLFVIDKSGSNDRNDPDGVRRFRL